ncbi:MAG: dynamin family protein, partial [Polyangiaceae bacterium]|nr:dynamin family protein [Polyangiaceae bacterium]
GFDAALLRDAHAALAASGVAPPEPEVLLALAAARLDARDPRGALGALGDAGEGAFAAHLRQLAACILAPPDGTVALDDVVAELRDAARQLGRDDVLFATETLARAAGRPPRAAVLGEFNAGKSTVVNALLGAEIAPMSVLPTTAVLHHLRYAAEPYARLTLEGGDERVVDPSTLAKALREQASSRVPVTRVTVGLPIEALRRVELIDTPGFNAPDAAHTREAERALDEVDVVLWIFDATQLGKASEVERLRALAAGGPPVLCVANKRDRLAPGELPAVERALRDAIDGAGVAPLRPPVVLSARQALAEKLGHADRSEGGASELDALFDEAVLRAAPSLHARSLRRRATSLVEALLSAATSRASAERDARDQGARAQRALTAHARRLEDAAAAQKAIGEAIAEARAALARDLCAVGHASDDDARGYVEDRVVTHLVAPLARALVEGERPHERLVAAVEAALRGLVAGLSRPGAVAELPAATLTRATVGAARAALHAAASAVPRGDVSASRLSVRLAALHDALRRQTPGTTRPALLSPAAT